MGKEMKKREKKKKKKSEVVFSKKKVAMWSTCFIFSKCPVIW
jgi:hypothetical protein